MYTSIVFGIATKSKQIRAGRKSELKHACQGIADKNVQTKKYTRVEVKSSVVAHIVLYFPAGRRIHHKVVAGSLVGDKVAVAIAICIAAVVKFSACRSMETIGLRLGNEVAKRIVLGTVTIGRRRAIRLFPSVKVATIAFVVALLVVVGIVILIVNVGAVLAAIATSLVFIIIPALGVIFIAIIIAELARVRWCGRSRLLARRDFTARAPKRII